MKNLLSEQYRNRRARLCQVNIKVNLIVWLVEFFGCMTMAIDFLLIGSRRPLATALLGTLTLLCYFILLPFTFLINCSTGINKIVDENWVDALMVHFKSDEFSDDGKSRGKQSGLVKNSRTSQANPISTSSKAKVESENETRSRNEVQMRTKKIRSSSSASPVPKEAWQKWTTRVEYYQILSNLLLTL